MHLDINSSELRVGIVGSGAMGRGIAQIAVTAGVDVTLFDARDGAVQEAVEFVESMLQRGVDKGRMDAAAATQAKACLHSAAELGDLTHCQVVVEAIIEELEAKQDLFRSLEDIVSDEAILATNTSSLSVTAIAASCRRPERVAGYHFFNPVPLMKIVEVIPGVRTAGWVTDALTDLAERVGHFPARAADTPGFLVNHAGRGFGTEALRILDEGIADHATIDRLLRDAAGFRLGPFELLDLTGLDVSHRVMESIYYQFYEEPRFRPSPVTKQRLTAGLLGRKVGEGFYVYNKDQEQKSPPQSVAGESRPVWISPADPQGAKAVAAALNSDGVTVETGDSPSDEAVCLVTPLGYDVTTTALEQGLDPSRTVAVDTFTELDRRRTAMVTPVTDHGYRDSALTALSANGVAVECIHDSAGFIVPRVVATIVNIGCDIAQRRIAEPKTIDRAVELGLGYPRGPLAMGDHYGAKRILAVLEAMHAFYGDPRYRPSPWLKRRALLGVSLTTPENESESSNA